MTYIIIRFYDQDPVIATREWLSTDKGWKWLRENVENIEWIEEAKCLLEFNPSKWKWRVMEEEQ